MKKLFDFDFFHFLVFGLHDRPFLYFNINNISFVDFKLSDFSALSLYEG